MNNNLIAGADINEAGDETDPASFTSSFFESLNSPVCIIGVDGIITYANKSFHDMVDNGGKDIRLDLEHPLFPEYRKRVATAYIQALKGMETQCFAVINLPDGTQKPIELYLFPLYENEKVDAILTMIRFADKRLLSFDRTTLSFISEENFKYDNLHFEFSPVPILRINEVREIVKVSQSFEGFFGFTSEDIFERKALNIDSIFIQNSDNIKKAISNIFNGEIPFKRIGEARIKIKDGSEKTVNLTLYPIIHESKIAAVEIIIEDLSKIYELKEEINSLGRERLLKDITKGFLHSLNNIINIITSKTQLLLQIAEKASVHEGIQVIANAADEITEQSRRIQNFIKDKSDTYEEKTEFIFDIIEDAIEFSRMQFKVEDRDRNRHISISKKYYTGANIKTDTRILREIIISVIIQVSMFIKKKGTISILLKELNDLCLTVAIDKNEESAAQTAIQEGMNIFPDINIRQEADKLKLKIIEEESSETYSIKIIFPLKMLVNKDKKEPDDGVFKLRGQNIIIVEDEKTLQKIIFDLFEKMGNTIVMFENGDDALAEFKKNHYDIVIADYDVGGMTGIELAARVKEIREDTVTVLLSGWELNNISSYKNIIDLFLPKPFMLDNLLKETAKLIKSKKN